MNALDFLTKIENGIGNVASIEEKLFDVIKVPLVAELKHDTNDFIVDDTFGMFKTSGGRSLGTVGNRFTPTQPKDLFNSFVSILENCNLNLDTLKFNSFNDGGYINFECLLNEYSHKNLRGLDDVMQTKLHVETGYNGKTSTRMFLSTYRMVCSNGMKAWRTDFDVMYRNTKNNEGKILLSMEDVQKSINSFSEYKDFLMALDKRAITPSEQKEFIKKVMKFDSADVKNMSVRTRKNYNQLLSDIEQEFKDGGHSAWALLNGITRYTNHSVKKTTEDSKEYVFIGQGAKINELAQETAFKMFL